MDPMGFIHGCLNWMIPNLYMKMVVSPNNHLESGCLGFQANLWETSENRELELLGSCLLRFLMQLLYSI